MILAAHDLIKNLSILLIEVAPAAYPKLDTSLAEFSDFMKELGYLAHSVDLNREVAVATLEKTTDLVFYHEPLRK